MKHRVGFHNPSEMQRELRTQGPHFGLLSRKKGLSIEKLLGDCVWMFTRSLKEMKMDNILTTYVVGSLSTISRCFQSQYQQVVRLYHSLTQLKEVRALVLSHGTN